MFDRTAAALPDGADLGAAQRASQQGTQFASMTSGGRWRERLGEIAAPTLVVHGEDDPFFPIGNGEALAAEIPGARLVRLPGVGQELPPRVWDDFARALLDHTPTPAHVEALRAAFSRSASRSSIRRILPVSVLGRSSTNSIARG